MTAATIILTIAGPWVTMTPTSMGLRWFIQRKTGASVHCRYCSEAPYRTLVISPAIVRTPTLPESSATLPCRPKANFTLGMGLTPRQEKIQNTRHMPLMPKAPMTLGWPRFSWALPIAAATKIRLTATSRIYPWVPTGKSSIFCLEPPAICTKTWVVSETSP